LEKAYFRAQEPDKDGNRGKIFTAASTAALYHFPTESVYAAAKHGVLGIVRALAAPLRPEGITINAIAPSLVGTPPDGTRFPIDLLLMS
jgi:NAD(P)-dependent dehydrogenase (short-subunit alcohol dehydrogenase family)